MAYLVALGCLGTALVVLLDGEVDLSMGGFGVGSETEFALVLVKEKCPRGCTHQDYIRGSPSKKMKKAPKVSNYFAYCPKVSSSLMDRTQKYHRIVKRQSDSLKSQYAPQCTIFKSSVTCQIKAKLTSAVK